jgi:hypothetical protein
LIRSIKIDARRRRPSIANVGEASSLIDAFARQAEVCAAFGSPFSAHLLRRGAEDMAAAGPTRGLLAPWSSLDVRQLFVEAAALRWLGALHDLALSGEAPALTDAYPAPSKDWNAPALWEAVLAVSHTQAPRLAGFMTHEPQTNEVRRSACLLPGFLTVAARTGLPLRIFELGASAGLNQFWDRYHYELGDAGTWGEITSPVRLDTAWRGPPPPLAAPVRVIQREACDRKPVDLADPAARRRLKAYVWADQFERLERLDAAIATALDAGVRVDLEDAPVFAATRAAPSPGAVTVVFHSVFFQYMPPESQAALIAALAAHGERAAADAPFAWLRMEPAPGDMATMELRLTLWPGGGDELLARVHPHGAWVEWLDRNGDL